MSEIINNRSHFSRKVKMEKLQELIHHLHKGKSSEREKGEFIRTFGLVSTEEQEELKQLLHGIHPTEMKKLLKVHELIQPVDDHLYISQSEVTGHPIHTFKLENKKIKDLIITKLEPLFKSFQSNQSLAIRNELRQTIQHLSKVDIHYTRKEQLLFPYLERYEIKGPSNMMWAIDDFMRKSIKKCLQLLDTYEPNLKEIVIQEMSFMITQGLEMIEKEENVVFPMALRKLTEDEWFKIAKESREIGFCLISQPKDWVPARDRLVDIDLISDGYVQFPTGVLSISQLTSILNHLPVDLTFIDDQDIVRFFSHGKNRIFHRTKSVIGRTVQNCHPPASVHIVNRLLDDFKSGKKDVEDFWIHLKDKFVLIRYFAVRNDDGEYLGTLEFTQDISPIQELEGEKRIMDI